MLNCEFCYQRHHLTFTRCCKILVCENCCQRQDRKLTCLCGRPLPQGHKNYAEYPQIMAILARFTQNKGRQCDRCDNTAQVQCHQCEMLFCQQCNTEVHAGLGFAKHNRKKIAQAKQNLQKLKKKDLTCLQHRQVINSGCECGAALCSQCAKQHKQACSKGYRPKVLKDFKEEYYISILLRMRQLSFFKDRLLQDKQNYHKHFKQQQNTYEKNRQLVQEQFQSLRKMIDIKCNEITSKMGNYWEKCKKVYHSTLARIEAQTKKYDQYAELLHLFAENLSNLDYFDKKIKRFNVNLDFINIKPTNIQHVQTSIMNIGIHEKPWEESNNEGCFENKQNLVNREDIRLLSSMQNTSELMLDYTNNPMKDRQLNILPSHSELFYNFIHLPFQNVKYEVQYGVGMKIKGQEIFKRVQNTNGYGIIEGLNPNTKYRVRMRVAEAIWGPVTEVTTLDIPKFNIVTSSFAKSMAENTVQLGKGGLIYGSNEIHFGVHRWVIKFTSKTISYEDSQTACMSVGVSNKQTKKAVFVGTTLNYGFQKSQIILRILLDCNEKRLVITNCSQNQEEVYQNLPNLPLFPTIQNKGNGQILVRYNLMTDDINSC